MRNLVSQALADTIGWDGGMYMTALNLALAVEQPSFESERYRRAFGEQAVDREWFASLLASNTYMEGYSAARLKQYAGVVGDLGLRHDLMRHAQDEARHSREFCKLIFLIFPQLDSAWLREEANAHVVDLESVTPCPADYPIPPDEEILNSMILMNLFEIKAFYLGNYLKPFAKAHSPSENVEIVQNSVSCIARDECFHIAYTAKHIDAFLRRDGLREVVDRIAGFVDMMNQSEDYSI